MSIYGRLACMNCKVTLWLGKTIFRSESATDHRVLFFHMGEKEEPLDSEQRDLSAVLWKLLADHTDHRLLVIIEGSREYLALLDDDETYEIGGDTFKDVSFADYLADWPGLLPPPQAVAEPGAPSARREVLTLVDPSFRAFERTLLRASLQLAFQGTLVLHVGDLIPVAEWLDQFARRRSGATLARYRQLQLLVLDPAGSPLYQGPLLHPPTDDEQPDAASVRKGAHMSRYAHLACLTCKTMLFLGRAYFAPGEEHRPTFFLRGAEPPAQNQDQRDLNRALWKMLADHAEHELRVVVEGSPDYARLLADESAIEVGGDAPGDPSLEEYLQDWPG